MLEPLDGANWMKITGLSPYWLDVAQGSAVHNTVDMKSLFLLTGPNGGGKSSLVRSICAAALLGICGFMIEMSEMRSIIIGATSRSLVLMGEICRGTETAKGTCIAGSIVETLDKIGCLGIASTHLCTGPKSTTRFAWPPFWHASKKPCVISSHSPPLIFENKFLALHFENNLMNSGFF
ncbi:hypothetical protein VitviT2T_004340 [Vitis vinifera]|uniref:DNA mismatch repair proteins mutS family domain-containing protein n=1 Tax=Vitis vinifera TaxID=29760 RepID=A0ABY9BP59_VITVI|nr:hypothetical protein VitviT2T_004340 [Vitis vinifera]